MVPNVETFPEIFLFVSVFGPVAQVIAKLKMVKKTDGKVPSQGAMSMVSKTFLKPKGKRGRKGGSQKTSKAENQTILKIFKKMRPPGRGDST